jgi:acetyl esterase/lipase
LRARFDASQIVVAGDSAGGHLAVDLCLSLIRDGEEQPAAVALLSPLADVTLDLARMRERAIRDPLASADSASRLVNHYIRHADPTHPRLRHVFGVGEVLPPTLIQAGGAEMLAADAHHLHGQLIESGSDCRLEVWPGQMHVFQAMPRLIPEADPALSSAARFLTHHLNQQQVSIRSTAQELGA